MGIKVCLVERCGGEVAGVAGFVVCANMVLAWRDIPRFSRQSSLCSWFYRCCTPLSSFLCKLHGLFQNILLVISLQGERKLNDLCEMPTSDLRLLTSSLFIQVFSYKKHGICSIIEYAEGFKFGAVGLKAKSNSHLVHW